MVMNNLEKTLSKQSTNTMNNLELRKALQKINHACIDCGGDGYSLCEHAGGHVPTDIETGEEYSPCTKECEQHNGNCKTCSGTGIDIPLEFGCTITVQEKYSEVPNPVPMIIISGRNGFGEFDTDRYKRVKNEDVIENLGKPSTLEDLLRALGKKMQYPVLISSNGTNFGTIHYYDEESTPKLISMMDYDLSKTVEEQTQEVTDQLIEILS